MPSQSDLLTNDEEVEPFRPIYDHPNAHRFLRPWQLETTWNSTTGSYGNMFDLVAKNSLSITQIGIHSDLLHTVTYEVYTLEGGYYDCVVNITCWTKKASGNAVARGKETPTPIHFAKPIDMDAGETLGFYVTLTTPDIRYSHGTEVDAVYAENRDLQLLEGAGISTYPLDISFFEPRVFNGVIYYDVAPWPTPLPSEMPTMGPTPEPTAPPTAEPTAGPTKEPTADPTGAPTAEPTPDPTGGPTPGPTPSPTISPTKTPTLSPVTESPTVGATTAHPTMSPVAIPPKITNAPTMTAVTTPKITAAPVTPPTMAPVPAPVTMSVDTRTPDVPRATVPPAPVEVPTESQVTTAPTVSVTKYMTPPTPQATLRQTPAPSSSGSQSSPTVITPEPTIIVTDDGMALNVTTNASFNKGSATMLDDIAPPPKILDDAVDVEPEITKVDYCVPFTHEEDMGNDEIMGHVKNNTNTKIMNARTPMVKHVKALVEENSLKIMTVDATVADDTPCVPSKNSELPCTNICFSNTVEHDGKAKPSFIKKSLQFYTDALMRYSADNSTEVSSVATITLNGDGVTEMSSNAKEFFEYVAYEFLTQTMQGFYPPVDINSVMVTNQRIVDVALKRKHARGISFASSFSSSVEVDTVITGEYVPPPEVNFDRVVKDSFDEQADMFMEQLKAHPSFEGVEGVAARKASHDIFNTTIGRSVNAAEVAPPREKSFFGSPAGIIASIMFFVMVGSSVVMYVWYKQSQREAEKRFEVDETLAMDGSMLRYDESGQQSASREFS